MSLIAAPPNPPPLLFLRGGRLRLTFHRRAPTGIPLKRRSPYAVVSRAGNFADAPSFSFGVLPPRARENVTREGARNGKGSGGINYSPAPSFYSDAELEKSVPAPRVKREALSFFLLGASLEIEAAK